MNFNKSTVIGVLVSIFFLVIIVLSADLAENLDSSEFMVIQYPNGSLETFTEPGLKAQWFGKVTKYPRQKAYVFGNHDGRDTRIKLGFNDGGTAYLSGSVNWEMPSDPKSIIQIHKHFASPEAIEQRAVVKMLDAAIYLSGPLMSSTESVSERRAELVNVINDQAERGVYVTRVEKEQVIDPLTKEEKWVSKPVIQMTDKGLPKRQQGSILSEFNIRLQPISIKELDYDDIVKKQIVDRQQSTTAVQLAQANAIKAEQDAITAAKQGEANAAQAKWEQEVIKAKLVTEAEQKRDVARLAKEEAQFFKEQQILMGQGEAERKRLVMQADGALDPKLKAYVEVQSIWANAFAAYKGNMTPSVVMGSDGKGGNSAANASSLVELLTAKTAKDLSLDLRVTDR